MIRAFNEEATYHSVILFVAGSFIPTGSFSIRRYLLPPENVPRGAYQWNGGFYDTRFWKVPGLQAGLGTVLNKNFNLTLTAAAGTII